MKHKNHLLALALSAVIATTSGCGGGGDGDSNSQNAAPDTSNLSETALKTSLTNGLTKGIAGNTSVLTNVMTKSKALQEVQGRGTGLVGNRSGAATRAADGGFGGDFGSGFGGSASGSGPDGGADDLLNVVNDVIEKSTVSKNGNIYTIDPNESAICGDPQLELDPAATQQCMTLLGGMNMVVTVNAVSGDEVTAATTQFKYKGETFVETDFTPTTAYYQVELAGSKTLLTDIKPMLDQEDRFDLPATMSGSIRLAASVPNENEASMTLSIPQTVRVVNTTPGEEIDLTLNRTDKLLMASANANTTTLDLEVGFQALRVLFNDEDAVGSFPIELTLNALTGKLSVTDNGDDLQITGLGVDTLKMKVDSVEALTVNMPKLDALLDASGTNAFVRLDKALDFALNMTNVRSYFDEEGAATDTTSITVKAPAGTVLTDAATDTIDAIQVTGGPLVVNVNENGTPASASVPTGSCLNVDSIATIACPASGS